MQLTKPLYVKRAALVSQIKGFWPLVFEQAPPDIDEYIQPSDSQVLLQSLTNLSVSRFEIEDGGAGDPRSVAIRFEFAANDYFTDTVIEKKFWYRRSKTGFAGLVSEPVAIQWKDGKDLTEGLLTLAKDAWDEGEQAGTNGTKTKRSNWTEKQKALRKKIEDLGLGGASFFSWFGYIGERVSAAESKAATDEEDDRRRRRNAGEDVPVPDNDDADDDDFDDDLEIFPNGDQLAIAISDDLWPGAIKYFSEYSPGHQHSLGIDHAIAHAQEVDALSEISFESNAEESDDDDEPPKKKNKTK